MGWADAFGWSSPAAIFREHAALSGYENAGSRVFDIGALAGLDDAAYDSLQPVRWPLPAGATGEGGRLFARGGFPTDDGRARIVPAMWQGSAGVGQRSLILNTGRVRDQWHTMTRTGLAPNLMTHTPEPLLTIHPADAAAAGIADGALARVSTAAGKVLLRAEVKRTQRRGEIFAPMHWSDEFASGGPVSRLVDGRVDPISGQPALKATQAVVEPVPVCFHGVLLRRRSGELPDICHWVRVPVSEGHLYRLMGLHPLPAGEDLTRFAAALVAPPAGAEWLEVSDPKRGVLRVAALLDGAVEAALFLALDPAALPREAALTPILGAPVADGERARLLAGRLYDKAAAEGPRVCACFGVTRDAVRRAVVTHRLRTAAEIGVVLGAGTNCGSCVPELQEILRDVSMQAA
jgi:assimilatory nitrate reductase catalytic subunit